MSPDGTVTVDAVSELDRLSAEELQGVQFIQLKGAENLTQEQLLELRGILYPGEPDVPDEVSLDAINDDLPEVPDAVSLDAVNDKLRDFVQVPGSCSRSGTPLLGTEVDTFYERLPQEQKAYEALIADGGRPTHNPDDTGLSIQQNPATHSDIIAYWYDVFGHGFSLLKMQEERWKNFRSYQDEIRQKNASSNAFRRYERRVREYRRSKGLESDAPLQANRASQSDLADWIERQYREHREADQLRNSVERADRRLEVSKQQLAAATDENGQLAEADSWRPRDCILLKARHGSAEIDYRKHSVLVAWVDDQVRQITSDMASSTEGQSSNDRACLGKRKTCTDDKATQSSSSPPKRAKLGVAKTSLNHGRTQPDTSFDELSHGDTSLKPRTEEFNTPRRRSRRLEASDRVNKADTVPVQRTRKSGKRSSTAKDTAVEAPATGPSSRSKLKLKSESKSRSKSKSKSKPESELKLKLKLKSSDKKGSQRSPPDVSGLRRSKRIAERNMKASKGGIAK